MSLLIFKILNPTATFHGIEYNERKHKKNKATLLYAGNFGHLQEAGRRVTGKEAKQFLNWWSSANTRIRNKQFHAILSCKEHSISPEKLKDTGLHIMESIGYRDNPVLVYAHNDTMHTHIHIITSRIDKNGKKIPHQFEGKRANEYLQQIIGMDFKAALQYDISDVQSYRCSTIAQYQLLFELKGYDTKLSKDDTLELYKYGHLQHAISLTNFTLLPLTKELPGLKQATALIIKHKKTYSGKLQEDIRYRPIKHAAQSPLTKYLHEKFGKQFIFFITAGHDKPYGYCVIDHKNHCVYKGSEVFRMESLLADNPFNTSLAAQATPKPLPYFEPFETSNGTNQHTNAYIPPVPVAAIIAKLEHDVENALAKENNPRRKRGRYT